MSEGDAADPPGPEQGGEGEPAEAASAGGVETLLQQILAGQQQHQQQMLALQQKQQPVPQQQQELHALPAGALFAQPAGGIIPHPLLPAHVAPAAAPANPSKSAGGKLTEKGKSKLWNSSAGPKYFLLCGGFIVGRGMDMARLQMLTRSKAHITEQAAEQISTLWACKIEHFFPPMAPVAVPTAMPTQVHFAMLIEMLMAAIEFGMDSAPEICVEHVRSLRIELKLVVERLKTYLQLHYMLFTPFETKVRNLLVEAINHGIDEGFHELAVQADEFQGNHQDGAPMPGTGDVVQVLKFRRLRKLLESDGMSNLAEQALGWKAAASALSAPGEKHKAAQPSGAAKAKAQKSKNTSGVGFPSSWACRAVWFGDTCRRNGGQYDHVNGSTSTAGRAAPAAAPDQPRQQQQTPQQIQKLQQQPQQQPQQQQ